MTRLIPIGFLLCVVIACLLPVTGSAAFFSDTSELEKRLTALEKTVATLQGQVAALQKENAAQQQQLNVLRGMGQGPGGATPTAEPR